MIAQFRPRERPLLVNGVNHQPEIHDVILIPQLRKRPRIDRILRNDPRQVHEDDSVPAIGLHPPVPRLEPGRVGARTVALRWLHEAVARYMRADLDRLEQDVVLRIAGHVRDSLQLAVLAGRHRDRFTGSVLDLKLT